MNAHLSEQPDQKTEARMQLEETILREPKNEIAWLRLSELVVDKNEVADCLRQAISINPNNYAAKQRLANIDLVIKVSRSKLEEGQDRNPKSLKRKASTAPERSDFTPCLESVGSALLNIFAYALLELLVSIITGGSNSS